MSMAVDFSTPLTVEERAYLESRGKFDEIQRADSINGVTNPPEPGAGDGTGPQLQPLLTSEQRAVERQRLRERLAVLDAEDDDDDSDLAPYEDWKVPELDAELKRRSLPVTGTKSDKVSSLYLDDEAAAPPQV